MLIALMYRDGFEPMREETDEDTEIRREPPEEFEEDVYEEYGSPVG